MTTLTFTPKGHRYRLDGKTVPSVTSILGRGVPKPALPYWAAKSVAEYVIDNGEAVESLRLMGRGPAVAALKGIPWESRDKAALRGTEIHALAEQLSHGEQIDLADTDPLLPVVQGLARFLDKHDPAPLFAERPVANRQHWYAGRPDFVGIIDGAVWLLDWKSSKGVYGETALQAAAYARCEFYSDEDGTEHEMPAIERIGVVHVTPDGSDLYDLGDVETAFGEFLHAKAIGDSIDRRNALVAHPIEVVG